MHISSIVVHADPQSVAPVREQIDATPGLETQAATDDGRLVVTVEAETEGASIALIDQVGGLAGVRSVAMVFHQYEPEPDLEV